VLLLTLITIAWALDAMFCLNLLPCRTFRETLDGRLKQLLVILGPSDDVQHCEKFLERLQHVHALRISTSGLCKSGSLLDHMPANLMMLKIICGRELNLEPLSRLRHITTLDVLACGGMTGLQTITGLTSLRCLDR
jgi:hypothetical protein